jgi:hypothetical protein
MEEFGLRTPEPDEIMSLVGETMDVFCCKIAPELDEGKQKELSDRITYYEKKAIVECGKVFDGIEDMLSELRGLGYKLAVCSNGRMQYIDCVLTSCGIKQYFDYVKGREAGKTKGHLVGELLKEISRSPACVTFPEKPDGYKLCIQGGELTIWKTENEYDLLEEEQDTSIAELAISQIPNLLTLIAQEYRQELQEIEETIENIQNALQESASLSIFSEDNDLQKKIEKANELVAPLGYSEHCRIALVKIKDEKTGQESFYNFYIYIWGGELRISIETPCTLVVHNESLKNEEREPLINLTMERLPELLKFMEEQKQEEASNLFRKIEQIETKKEMLNSSI